MSIAPNHFEYCTIHNVYPGDVLYQHLEVENRTILQKGDVLTERIIQVLKNRNVKQICIERRDMHVQAAELQPLQDIFYQAVGYNSLEMRYGRVLKDPSDIQFVKDIFLSYMVDKEWRDYFFMIKDFDAYTFLHMIDVFTLATLFAKTEQIPHIARFASGYLFYDVGTLYTSLLLLQKKRPFTKAEFEVVQQHVHRGQEILSTIRLDHVAHFAAQHHERYDGSGYPHGLKGNELSTKVQILHIVDTYSALTMERAHCPALTASEAFQQMYRMGDQFNQALLNRFIEFIGIYPERAVVKLSNGQYAQVEAVNTFVPLMPTVRLMSGKQLTLPIDMSIQLEALVSYEVDSPKALFTHLSNYLIKGDDRKMISYYEQLKMCYEQKDWSTQILIPVFQLLQALKKTNYLQNDHFKHALKKLYKLLDETLCLFQSDEPKQDMMLVVVQGTLETPAIVKVFESLLYANGWTFVIMPYVESAQEVEQMINAYHVQKVIAIGGDAQPCSPQYYHLTELQLTNVLTHFSGRYLYPHDLEVCLRKYEITM